MLKKILFLSCIFFLSGCQQLNDIGKINNTQKYPTNIGSEWEYNTSMKLDFYNSTGHIDSTSSRDLGNSIVRIIKERDSVGFYNDLVQFECFDLNSVQYINKIWYLNADSGLFAVAYSNAGASQFVFPKRGFSNFEQLKKFIKLIGTFPGSFDGNSSSNVLADTIQHYAPARKVLTYPLAIDSRWIELAVPFFRERFIEKQQIVNTNSRDYNCYKLESKMNWNNIQLNDYVDLYSGLVKREIIADSVQLVTITNPDSGLYVRSTTISILVREKK